VPALLVGLRSPIAVSGIVVTIIFATNVFKILPAVAIFPVRFIALLASGCNWVLPTSHPAGSLRCRTSIPARQGLDDRDPRIRLCPDGETQGGASASDHAPARSPERLGAHHPGLRPGHESPAERRVVVIEFLFPLPGAGVVSGRGNLQQGSDGDPCRSTLIYAHRDRAAEPSSLDFPHRLIGQPSYPEEENTQLSGTFELLKIVGRSISDPSIGVVHHPCGSLRHFRRTGAGPLHTATEFVGAPFAGPDSPAAPLGNGSMLGHECSLADPLRGGLFVSGLRLAAARRLCICSIRGSSLGMCMAGYRGRGSPTLLRLRGLRTSCSPSPN